MDSTDSHNYIVGVLRPWMRQQLSRAAKDPSTGHCTRFDLHHVTRGQTGSLLESVPVEEYNTTENFPSDDVVTEYASAFARAAVDDAVVKGRGLQQYTAVSYFANRPEFNLKKSFRCAGIAGDSFSAGVDDGIGVIEDSETPDAKGIVTQHMRHTEAMMKQSVMMAQRMMEMMAGQNQMLAEQNSALISGRLKSIEVHENLMDRSHQRKLEEKAQEAKMKMWEEVGEKLKILLPHAVNKLAGQRVMPSEYSPEELEFVALLQSMGPEQIDALRGVLKPEQTAVLWSVVEKVMKKHGDAEEQRMLAEAESKQPIPKLKSGGKKRRLLTGGALGK